MAEKVKKNVLLTILKVILIAMLIVIMVVGGYVAYYMLASRREGNKVLLVSGDPGNVQINLNYSEYSLLSWNIGFGAYTDDYSFFMDGGKYSRARSEQSVIDGTNAMCDFVKYGAKSEAKRNFDFVCLQEVDEDGTRSYHVNQAEIFKSQFSTYANTYAINYNTPYTMYPLNEPIGKNKSGILTMSRFAIVGAKRVELPVEDSMFRYFDLDRCFTVNRFKVNKDSDLVVINLHLSAYTHDLSLGKRQLQVLIDECKKEIKNGNFVICAGDFNKDLLGNSGEIFGHTLTDLEWAKPIEREVFKDSGMKLIAPFDEEKKIPSCRNADSSYTEDDIVLTVDGFLVSDNVKVVKSGVCDQKFKYSDHNPVYLNFKLVN